ncbi:hypothetical protein ACWDZX_11385 [Streptomyces collinus]
MTQLGGTAVRLGLGRLVIGIAWLAAITKGFRRPAPEMRLGSGETSGPTEPEASGPLLPTG